MTINRDEKCTTCGFPRHAHWGDRPVVAGRCSGFEGSKAVSVKIRWGRLGENDETFTFLSQELLDAFLRGVEATCGWMDYEVIEDKTEEGDSP